MSGLGYVVVEFNQASGQPDLGLAASIYATREEALELARSKRAETLRIGRGERYSVAEVVEDVSDVEPEPAGGAR